MNPRLSSSKLLIKQRSTKTGQAILGQDDPYAKIGHVNDRKLEEKKWLANI
jgi:hypothetical protein